MKHKSLDKKIYECQYAFQTYGHLMNEIKDILRSGQFDKDKLYIKMQLTDDFIIDNTPLVDKYNKKYDTIFNVDQ